MNNELNLISKDSEASDIELDTKYVITDHNNKVYCRCYKEGYGSLGKPKPVYDQDLFLLLLDNNNNISNNEINSDSNINSGNNLNSNNDINRYESLQEYSSNSSSFSHSDESLNSSIANNISEELAIALRLFKVKVQYNLTDEAFQQTIIAANVEPITIPGGIRGWDRYNFSKA
ncbi:5179_t:CDS:2, partial [Gigaspora rosea]